MEFAKKIAMITLFSLFCVASLQAASESHEKTHRAIASKVNDLLARMTTEEKIGQMTQLTITVIADLEREHGGWQKLDADKLHQALTQYHVGSIINVDASAYSLENWREIISQIQKVAATKTRLAIPVLYGIDAIHGMNYTVDATLFPQSIGMAATWNEELVKKSAEITAIEMKASGIPWNFNPVLGAGRQPLWSRLWETFGEDAYLASVLAHAYVKGTEGDDNQIGAVDKGAACIKHYLGYSLPLTGKDRTPAYIPERMLREHFLPIFKAGVDAGAHTVMVNSSEINGVPVHGSHYYLTELLRDELGFKGFVVSDWEDIIRLYTRHKVAATPKEAVRMAVMAGIDMSMVPMDYSFYELLLELVKDGDVPIERIDEAVARILTVKFELGLFEKSVPGKSLIADFVKDEFAQVNLQAARESITLLKNAEKTLPLAKNTRLLVTGPTANKLTSLNGGWTITWQGNDESLYPKEHDTILEAVQKKFGKSSVTYVEGTDFTKDINTEEAVAVAKNADVAILCLGEDAYCEVPGTIADLTLPQAQLDLAQKIAETGTPTVLVLAQGRPRIINAIADTMDAIVMAYLPGLEGGTAMAEILAGEVNPSGKLPITYPRYPNDLTLYDHKVNEVADEIQSAVPYHPQFEFGYGLSYTTFAYDNLQIEKSRYQTGEAIQVSVDVQNTGKVAGKETVQLYLSDLIASITPYNKRLKRFAKVALQPGEKKTVTFTLHNKDLAFIGLDHKPTVEPGEFKVTIADLSTNFMLE